ncbi:hypothetical protein [Salarchaeum sp. JOR-1]|uniref:hypothetical protein n=1 Tax=Salarchaeum sp. JOR-1 TaxID=2599399 RepID=UPI001198A9FB|nr:hypothetical protein [Salarchaeum sp. JOR-1]QDX40858.1 hypothetical protein FQU85_08070 [Salarchaeum sp. JOR-1]
MDWDTLVGALGVLGILVGALGALVSLGTNALAAPAGYTVAAAGATLAVGWGVVAVVALVGAGSAATKTTPYW